MENIGGKDEIVKKKSLVWLQNKGKLLDKYSVLDIDTPASTDTGAATVTGAVERISLVVELARVRAPVADVNTATTALVGVIQEDDDSSGYEWILLERA